MMISVKSSGRFFRCKDDLTVIRSGDSDPIFRVGDRFYGRAFCMVIITQVYSASNPGSKQEYGDQDKYFLP